MTREMRRLLLLLCYCVVVHAFAGPSNSRSVLLLSSRSSRTAVIVGESTASHQQSQPLHCRTSTSLLSIGSNDEESIHQQQPNPKTFREGEVLGLRLMQSGKHDEALQGELNC
jgi:hypothetical protein